MKNSSARYHITYPSRKPTPAAKEITHERIAEDLAAFQSAGGEIEVLGVTSTLRHIGLAAKSARKAYGHVDATGTSAEKPKLN